METTEFTGKNREKKNNSVIESHSRFLFAYDCYSIPSSFPIKRKKYGQCITIYGKHKKTYIIKSDRANWGNPSSLKTVKQRTNGTQTSPNKKWTTQRYLADTTSSQMENVNFACRTAKQSERNLSKIRKTHFHDYSLSATVLVIFRFQTNRLIYFTWS